MGRIQKKKTATTKKKGHKNGIEGAQPNRQDEAAAPAEKKSRVLTLKKSAPAVKAPAVKTEKNFIDKSLQFLREVRVELKKVTWPSRKQTIGSTVVVIILVMIISFFLGLVDFGLSNLIRAILH